MKILQQSWYRWIDRELDTRISFPEREGEAWNRWVGETGERLARKQLWRMGHRVLYRNFRAKGGGEVDLVTRDGEILVFVEVKARTSVQFGRPAEAVDSAKQGLLIRGANAWLRELNLPEVIFRFDIVEVLLEEGEKPGINVIENAFTTPQVGLGL